MTSTRDVLLKAAHDRLHPSLSNPNYLVLHFRRKILERWIHQLDGNDLRVLDIGGRYQPYRPLFDSRTARYIACDIVKTDLVDVVGSGEALPFARDAFDAVVATQVFDYFARPHRAAEEMHAVLKPGGALLMSVPSMAPRFADQESWRFTPTGIRALLSDFTSVEIIPETSSLGGLIRTFNLGLHSLVRSPVLRKMHELTVSPCFNLLGLAVEHSRWIKNDQFAPNYSVRATK